MMFVVEIYCGGIYCGNAIKKTYGECLEFFYADDFCDKAIIKNLGNDDKKVVRK